MKYYLETANWLYGESMDDAEQELFISDDYVNDTSPYTLYVECDYFVTLPDCYVFMFYENGVKKIVIYTIHDLFSFGIKYRVIETHRPSDMSENSYSFILGLHRD